MIETVRYHLPSAPRRTGAGLAEAGGLPAQWKEWNGCRFLWKEAVHLHVSGWVSELFAAMPADLRQVETATLPGRSLPRLNISVLVLTT